MGMENFVVGIRHHLEINVQSFRKQEENKDYSNPHERLAKQARVTKFGMRAGIVECQ